MSKKIKKIELVPQSKVLAWIEDHPNWTSPAEAAESFNADAVVAVEIGHYSIENPKSPGLFSGAASVHVQVVEMLYPKDERGRPDKSKSKEPESSFEDSKEIRYPRVQGQMPVDGDVNRTSFKQKFLDEVTNEISWYFVNHTTGDTIQNTRFTPE